jgi:CheY-like chemotaxis protein
MSQAAAKKILMVEDDDAQSLMYQIEFKNFGLDLIVVSDGEQAHAEIVKQQPDLVLLDMLIGRVSGLDVLNKLRADPQTKNIKVVVISNYNKKEVNVECKKAGALDYWVKSDYVPRQIVEKVQAILK